MRVAAPLHVFQYRLEIYIFLMKLILLCREMAAEAINFAEKRNMESKQQPTPGPQMVSLENLPPTIFGVSTQDALTVIAGLAMAAIGINKIINAKK